MRIERNNAHVIVLGNEKGGSGKSTTAIHLAVQLLYEGHRVATIDCDSRQQTFTTYVRNRREWARAHGVSVPHPIHFHLPRAQDASVADRNGREFDMFRQAVADVERDVDFLIVDTPGFDTHLTRIAHSLADTLVTPLNDSLIDLDVVARIDPERATVVELSHYTRLVQRSRRERLSIDGKTIDWIIVRNRVSTLNSRNARLIQLGLEQVSARVGCRIADGIGERVVFRSLFPIGMTLFDPLDESVLGGSPTMSHVSARQEYRHLIEALNLPTSPRAHSTTHRYESALNGTA